MFIPSPEFEWRINLGTLLETVVLGVPIIWGLLRMYFVIGEHPPHSHYDGEGKRVSHIGDTFVTYPRGRK